MFQPETEDMLPRMAPKPSAAVPAGSSEEIIRPQVPEVSIMFGQQDNNLLQPLNSCTKHQQQNNDYHQQTYAAWKKQMLPKTTYPAAANMANMQRQDNALQHNYNSPQTNLYPLRSTSNAALNIASNGNLNGFGSNPLPYGRSLENCNMIYQPSSQLPVTTSKLLTTQSPSYNTNDVLTICAGTQTDGILDQNHFNLHIQSDPWSPLASKRDIEDLKQILNDLKVEQQRIVKMLETVLSYQHKEAVKKQCREIGIQADCTKNDAFYGNGLASIPDQQSLPINKFLQPLKSSNNNLQTPNGKPVAQSTTYRPNSVQTQRLPFDLPELTSAPTFQQDCNKPSPIMLKSASDTSLAMNELALKYLPNEKLAELIKELNMNCPLPTLAPVTTTAAPLAPLRENMDKFIKGPSDISNDSYKYLKKYRLLPEDNVERGDNAVDGDLANVNENQMPQYNSPQQCNNVRNTPFNQRHTPTNKCAPYAGRLPLSPLARATTPPQQSTQTQNLVNLENIKHQPKFL